MVRPANRRERLPYCKRLGDGSSSSGHWSRQCAAHSFGSDAACLRERLAPQHVASARGGSAARTAVRQSCGSKSSAESSSAGAGSRLHPTRLRGTRRCIAFTAPAVPTRRFDRSKRTSSSPSSSLLLRVLPLPIHTLRETMLTVILHTCQVRLMLYSPRQGLPQGSTSSTAA